MDDLEKETDSLTGKSTEPELTCRQKTAKLATKGILIHLT